MKATVIVESKNQDKANTYALDVYSIEDAKQWFANCAPEIDQLVEDPEVDYVCTTVLDDNFQVVYYKEFC